MVKHVIISCLVLISVGGCCSKNVNAVNRETVGKWVLVSFDTREGYDDYFEFTESHSILRLQNVINEITDPCCNKRMQITGDRAELYFYNSGKCDKIISIYAQSVPGIGGKWNFKQKLLESQFEKRKMLFDFSRLKGKRISETEVVMKIAKSVLVLLTRDDGDLYFEFTGFGNISRLENFLQEIAVPSCKTRMEVIGPQTVLYSFDFDLECGINSESIPAAGKEQNSKTDSNLASQDKLFKFLLANGHRISELDADEIIHKPERNCECLSWEK